LAQTAIFLPATALVILTLGIGSRLFYVRIMAVRRGDISAAFYKLNRGGRLPDYVARVSQNYDNLLELPVLFYVAAFLIYATQSVDVFYTTMAWVFVGLRVVHSGIHTTYNNVLHRAWVFLGGFIVLVIIWLRLLSQLILD
jgi:hypothetical protein